MNEEQMTGSFFEQSSKGRIHFENLLRGVELGRYDDAYLEELIEYHRLYPWSEKFDVFYAKYAMAHKNYHVALEYIRKAYRKRKASAEIWKLLVTCHEMLGNSLKTVFFQGLLKHHYGVPLQFQIPGDRLEEYLAVLTRAFDVGHYAPFHLHEAFWGGNGLEIRPSISFCEYICGFVPGRQESLPYAYWVGAYAEEEDLEGKTCLLEENKGNESLVGHCGAGTVFDFMKSRSVPGKVAIKAEGDMILPVAGTESKQIVSIEAPDAQGKWRLGKGMYSFFRLQGNTIFSSEQPFVIGEPIFLRHSPKRKKLVLNILLDALSWGEEKERNFLDVPNIIGFFKKGIIFNQHFSIAEYTYPAFAAIETGMHLQHSQIFNETASVVLDEKYKTISECMKDLGYYCASLMGNGCGVYNGVTRGYDRLLVAPYSSHVHEGVERVIRQLEAFGECDQFLMVHAADTHPWRASDYQVPVATQTHLSLKDLLPGAMSKEASVRLSHVPLYEHANLTGIRNSDRSLGVLFDYLESHYREDEYLVTLYSDHGTSVYDDFSYTFSDKQGGAALMMRGAGVPQAGFVEELVSSLDIYPMLGHVVGFEVGDWVDGNLPRIFGGKEREYVISNSIFPGKEYQLCIRTQEHEFHLQSVRPVEFDGTVDLREVNTSILLRDGSHREVKDDTLLQYFLQIAREHTKSFNNEGHVWPLEHD